MEDTKFHYLTNSRFNAEDELFASTTTLSLAPERKAILNITNTSVKTLTFTGDIITLIKAAINEGATSIDWINTNEFDIIIKFNADMTTDFTINGWNIIDENLEIGG